MLHYGNEYRGAINTAISDFKYNEPHTSTFCSSVFFGALSTWDFLINFQPKKQIFPAKYLFNQSIYKYVYLFLIKFVNICQKYNDTGFFTHGMFFTY